MFEIGRKQNEEFVNFPRPTRATPPPGRKVIFRTSKDDLKVFVQSYREQFLAIQDRFYIQDQAAITRAAVEKYIKTGDSSGLIVQIPTQYARQPQYITDYLVRYGNSLRNAVLKAARIMGDRWRSKFRRSFPIQAGTAAIDDFLRNESLDWAVRLSRQRWETLQDWLIHIKENNIGLKNAIQLLRQQMVITPKQAAGVRRTFDAAIKKGKTRSEALEIARKVSEAKKEARALLQLRTEYPRAMFKGQHEFFRQAEDSGLIKAGKVIKVWTRNNFKDNHPESIDLDGTSVPLREPFTHWTGTYMYPSNFNELCTLAYLVYTGGGIFQSRR